MIVIATMVGSLFLIPLSYADMMQDDKSKQTEQKQATDKEKDKKTKRGDTGPMGEEKTGGSGPSGTSGSGDVKAPQHEGAAKKKQ